MAGNLNIAEIVQGAIQGLASLFGNQPQAGPPPQPSYNPLSSAPAPVVGPPAQPVYNPLPQNPVAGPPQQPIYNPLPSSPAPVYGPAPAPVNPWLPLEPPAPVAGPPPQPVYNPLPSVPVPVVMPQYDPLSSAPGPVVGPTPQPIYNPLPPSLPAQGPVVQGPAPAPVNPWLPYNAAPGVPSMAELGIRPQGMGDVGVGQRPDLGAPGIGQSGVIGGQVVGSNVSPVGPVQGPVTRPVNYNPYFNREARPYRGPGVGVDDGTAAALAANDARAAASPNPIAQAGKDALWLAGYYANQAVEGSPALQDYARRVKESNDWYLDSGTDPWTQLYRATAGGLTIAGDTLNVGTKLLAEVPLGRMANAMAYVVGTGGNPAVDQLTAGDVLGGLGAGINRILNPLNPNKVEWDGWLPDKAWASVVDNYLNDSIAVHTAYDAMSKEDRAKVAPALNLLGSSGPDRAGLAMNEIMNRPAMVAGLMQQAERRQAAGDDLGAARLFNRAMELQNRTTTETINYYTRAWGEIVQGVLLDPTAVFGPVAKLAEAKGLALTPAAAERIRYANWLADLTPEVAGKELQKALDEGARLVKRLDATGTIAGAWQKYNPFAKTIDSVIETTSTQADTILGQVLAQANTGAEARQILEAVLFGTVNKGVQLADRMVYLSPVVTGAKESVEAIAKLKVIAQDILTSPVLQNAEGALNKWDALGELSDTIHAGLRKVMGKEGLPNLPAGTKSVRTAGTAAGTFVKKFNQAGQATLMSGVKMVGNTQRAIMSSVYLNLRPAHWVRNSVSAWLANTLDGNMSYASVKNIVNDLAALSGGAVPVEIRTAIIESAKPLAEAAKESPWSFGGRWVKGNPLATVDAAAQKVWQSVDSPLGENAFRVRAFYAGFQKFFRPNLNRAVRTFYDELVRLGVDGQFARALADHANEVGVMGREDLITALRESINAATLPFTFRSLGIEADALPTAALRDVAGLVKRARQGLIDVAGVMRELDDIAVSATEGAVRSLLESPLQPGRKLFTEQHAVQDALDGVGLLSEAAQKAGVAESVAVDVVQQAMQVQRDALQAIRQEIAAAPTAAMLNAGIEYWWKIDQEMRRIRSLADGLNKGAKEFEKLAPGAAAIGQKWRDTFAETSGLWTEFTQFVQREADATRIAGMNGQATGVDLIEVMQKYLQFDLATNAQLRESGATLLTKALRDAKLQDVIAAGREYGDQALSELLFVFRRYPSQSAFDIIVSAHQDTLAEGGRVVAAVRSQMEKMLEKGVSVEAYYKFSHDAWHAFFDASVARYNAAKVEVVLADLAEKAGVSLAYADGFGTQYRVVQAQQNGKWLIKNLDTNEYEVTQMVDLRGVSNPANAVPEEVAQAYRELIDGADATVQRVVAETKAEAKNAPLPNPPQNREGIVTGQVTEQAVAAIDQGMAAAVPSIEELQKTANNLGLKGGAVKAFLDKGFADLGLEAPASFVEMNALQRGLAAKLLELREIGSGKAKAAVEGAQKALSDYKALLDAVKAQRKAQKESRIAVVQLLRDEWDRVAVGEWGLPDLNKLMVRFKKHRTKGQFHLTSVPEAEKMFQDLYGTRIANIRIENLGDVEAYLSQYVQNLERTRIPTNLPPASSAATSSEIVGLAEPLLRLIGFGDADIEAMVKEYKTSDLVAYLQSLASDVGAIEDVSVSDAIRTWRDANPTATINPAIVQDELRDAFGMAADGADDLGKALAETNGAAAASQGTIAPTVAAEASQRNEAVWRTIETLKRNISEILQPKPMQLNEGQRLRAVDALNKFMQAYDGVVVGATKVARDGMNFSMLNFADRRKIDAVMGYMFPFHYYWSRGTLNWTKRIASNPQLAHLVGNAYRGIDVTQQQLNDSRATRLQDTLPNPLYPLLRQVSPAMADNFRYVSNPMTWLLPYNTNDFVDPDAANNEFERWLLTTQQYLPGFMPGSQFAIDAAFDLFSPLPNGRKRLDKYQAADYLPLARMAGYARQMATGELPPGQVGDEFDYGRVAREIALVAGYSAAEKKMAQDMLFQLQNGLQPLPEQAMTPRAQELLKVASQNAGLNRFVPMITGWLTGVNAYPYSDTEEALRSMAAERRTLGYDANPYGSQAAVDAFDNGVTVDGQRNIDMLSPWWSYRTLYPQDEPVKPADRPGVQASTSMMFEEKKRIGAAFDAAIDDKAKYATKLGQAEGVARSLLGDQAVDQWLADNPNAKMGELIKWSKDTYLANKYPSAMPTDGSGIDHRTPGEKAADEKVATDRKTAQQASAAESKFWDEYYAVPKGERAAWLRENADRAKLYLDGYDPNQRGSGKGSGLVAGTDLTYDQLSGFWNDYKKLTSTADKIKFMQDNPEFAAYYKAKYGDWWSGRTSSSGGGGTRRSGGGGGGGGGRSYPAKTYSTILPGIGTYAVRAPRVDPRYIARELQQTNEIKWPTYVKPK